MEQQTQGQDQEPIVYRLPLENIEWYRNHAYEYMPVKSMSQAEALVHQGDTQDFYLGFISALHLATQSYRNGASGDSSPEVKHEAFLVAMSCLMGVTAKRFAEATEEILESFDTMIQAELGVMEAIAIVSATDSPEVSAKARAIVDVIKKIMS